MSYKLTKKETLAEIVKSGKDPVYFINSYARISHPMHGLIPFKMYDYQDDLINNFNDHRFTVILKARQLGISTVTAAYIAWMMMFHRDKNILVMATKFSTAGNLVKKVKAIIKHLPSWMKITDVSVDNRTSFELSNGSQIKASSTSGDAGRSEALSLRMLMVWMSCGPVFTPHYPPVGDASLFLLLMAWETGFIKHMLIPRPRQTIFTQLG